MIGYVPPHSWPGSASGSPHIWPGPQCGGSDSAAPGRGQRSTRVYVTVSEHKPLRFALKLHGTESARSSTRTLGPTRRSGSPAPPRPGTNTSRPWRPSSGAARGTTGSCPSPSRRSSPRCSARSRCSPC